MDNNYNDNVNGWAEMEPSQPMGGLRLPTQNMDPPEQNNESQLSELPRSKQNTEMLVDYKIIKFQ